MFPGGKSITSPRAAILQRLAEKAIGLVERTPCSNGAGICRELQRAAHRPIDQL